MYDLETTICLLNKEQPVTPVLLFVCPLNSVVKFIIINFESSNSFFTVIGILSRKELRGGGDEG